MANKPPANPPSTDDGESGDAALRHRDEQPRTGGSTRLPSANNVNPFLEDIDKLNPQELADFMYALAEEIIASPQEYKIKMGLEQLDVDDLDNIDLNTPAGRKKLAALLRLLAEQVFRSKEHYQASILDKSKAQGQSR